MKTKTIISIFLLAILGMLKCSGEKNPITTGENPVISDVKMQDNWSTKSSAIYKAEVKVEDPQGPGNLSNVSLTVHESSGGDLIFSDSLYDDGGYFFPEAGDVLAGDGVYANRFRAIDISKNSTQTEFIFKFIAFDEQNHKSQIWEYMVTFGENSPPVIMQIIAPDSFSYRDANSIFSITVSDSNGIEDIVKAYFDIKDLTKGFTQFGQDLYNDGDLENNGDMVEGDSIFSTRINTDFLVARKGPHELIFHIEDTKQEQNVDEAKHIIYIENNGSQFLDFTIPGLMDIPAVSEEPNRALMEVEVSDSEGLADIDSVYFYSQKPDSTLANGGQPFLMVDNGLEYNPEEPLIETGDKIAGDGIYSLSLLVNPGTAPGIYTFSFYIRDKAGNLAGPVNRTIELTTAD